jgi:hypothetical protein
MHYLRYISTAVLSLSLYQSVAQKRTYDMATWIGLSVKQSIYNKLSYRVMARLRDTENLSSITSYYVDAGLYYKIKKTFSVSLDYVYAPSKMADGYFTTYHQYYVSFNNKLKLNNYWYFSNRIIFQHTSHFFIVDNGYEPYSRTDAREKLTLNRKVARADKLYISDEVMTTLFTGNTELRRNRLYIGLNHSFSRQLSMDFFFVLQSTFNRKNNTSIFVYGLTVNYKFKKMFEDD